MPPSFRSFTLIAPTLGSFTLHGRLGNSGGAQKLENHLVLSSSDLGRAYLADGWATEFVRQLLERRVIVFLGYSANDPPIRFLLQGLASSSSLKPKGLFAFDRGEELEVRSRWDQLGVEGIAFSTYDQLWETIERWSARARDPERWSNDTIELAAQGPKALRPFQRGQVASMLSMPQGARAFSVADPPPPAEWLCVLDRNARYAPPIRIQVTGSRATRSVWIGRRSGASPGGN